MFIVKFNNGLKDVVKEFNTLSEVYDFTGYSTKRVWDILEGWRIDPYYQIEEVEEK